MWPFCAMTLSFISGYQVKYFLTAGQIKRADGNASTLVFLSREYINLITVKAEKRRGRASGSKPSPTEPGPRRIIVYGQHACCHGPLIYIYVLNLWFYSKYTVRTAIYSYIIFYISYILLHDILFDITRTH